MALCDLIEAALHNHTNDALHPHEMQAGDIIERLPCTEGIVTRTLSFEDVVAARQQRLATRVPQVIERLISIWPTPPTHAIPGERPTWMGCHALMRVLRCSAQADCICHHFQPLLKVSIWPQPLPIIRELFSCCQHALECCPEMLMDTILRLLHNGDLITDLVHTQTKETKKMSLLEVSAGSCLRKLLVCAVTAGNNAATRNRFDDLDFFSPRGSGLQVLHDRLQEVGMSLTQLLADEDDDLMAALLGLLQLFQSFQKAKRDFVQAAEPAVLLLALIRSWGNDVSVLVEFLLDGSSCCLEYLVTFLRWAVEMYELTGSDRRERDDLEPITEVASALVPLRVKLTRLSASGNFPYKIDALTRRLEQLESLVE